MGKMAGGPALNLQSEEKSNTNQTKIARKMATPRLHSMGLLYFPGPHIEKVTRVEILYPTLTKTR